MADPISGTIAAVSAAASYIGSAFAASAVGTATLAQAATVFAVNAAATIAVNVAATALLQPKVGSSGPTMDFKSDTTAPIRGVMGRMAVGGNRIFKRTWGRTNVYLTSVALLSLGPCQAVEQFKANDQFVSFGQAQGGASGKYAGHMWMTYRMGLPGTSALTPPQGVFIENPKLTAWTSQHRADGHVTAMWTLAQAEDQTKRDLYQNEPDPMWIGRWMKVWDPRQDSTYPGGSGSQRRDQWNTWGYTDNPYLHALAWIRGHAKLNADGTVDRTKRIAGVGAPDRAIDIANYVEGANIADANGWKIAGEWSTSDDKWQVLAAMLQAGGGVPLNQGAQISCMVNTPRASIYTYTRNDLVGGATVKALKARRDRKNTVVPRYRSEAHGWEIVPAGAVTSSVYRDEDRGEPRTIEIEYSYVTSAKQAGELGAYDVANMREGLETSLPSKPHLLGLRAGDAFTTDLPELGLVAQKFIVQRRAFDPQTGVVTLDVLSETDAKHAWALGQTENPPPTPSLVGVDPDYVAPPELPEWTVVVRPPAGDGSQQPGFEIIGGSPAADASSVVMEHGQSPTGPWKQFYDGALKTTGRVPIDGLQPGEVYYVAVRYRRDSSGALSDRTIYGPYTAPSLTAGDTAAVAGYPASDLLKDVRDVQDLAGRTHDAVADLEQVYGDTASAAQSAADAAASQAGAAQAKADAVVARGEARTAAGDALAKAQAAAGSSAAADAAKTASETARDAAIQKALDAAGAAETAGAAKTAAETASAGAAAEALKAAQKAGEASGSAQAAAGSAGTASSKATEAGTSAAAALASSVTATTARDAAKATAINSLPDLITPDTHSWSYTGSPANLSNATGITNGEASTSSLAANFAYKGVVLWEQGRIYELAIEGTSTGPAGNAPRLLAWACSLTDAYVNNGLTTNDIASPLGVRTTNVVRFGLGVLPPTVSGKTSRQIPTNASTRFVRFFAGVNYGNAGGSTTLHRMTIRDVTAQVAAEGSAAASATSASKAGAHEDAAGQSATAANTAKTQAETARGQAQGFRNEAADSATTATGAAATATQQAGLSAGARDQAQGHAAAASGSAELAGTKADEAGVSAEAARADRVAAEAAREGAEGSASASAESASSAAASETAAGSSASAAQTARTGAETARGQAQTYASNASDSADDAAGSASTATQQAGLATTARNAAQGSADAAAGSASTASSKATEAGTSAAAALASSVTATTARDGAADLFYRQFPPVLDPVGRLGYEGYSPIFGPNAAWPTPYISEEAPGSFTNKEVRHTRMIPKVVGRRYRVECWVFSYATNVAFIAKRHDFEDEAGGSIRFRGQLEPCEVGAPYVTPAGLAFYLVAGEFTIPADDQAFTRPYIEAATNNGAPSDERVHIGGIKITDVTERTAANGYANASATSAASAAASETATEQSASAASEAKNLAETARGQAQTFRDEAADSVTTAAGSAATATQQARIATDARDAAAGSASAALTSRNQASSFADEAETAASVSTSQKLLAEAARDQALKALLEQGRLNLVRRTRVTAGQVVGTSEGLSGWGFSMVGTGSDAQERSIAVGPLKQNTPYSLSFWARRLAGGGSLPITFDLFPDTLPERTFDIQSNVWTRYTWENFSSAHDDMTLPSIVARFFRPNMEAGVNVEIAAIKLEEGATATAWTPSPFDAADSASAAATSAASASASDTAAGQQAAASQADRVRAETARAGAEGAESRTATSETNAAGSASLAAQQAGIATDARNAADDAAEAAAGSASTASSKADEAGVQASAALASQVSATASRDQALKALLEQGRTNLVRRTRATAGQVVATSEGLSGWGFSMVGTGSDAQERSIVVGPLKQNTPYSLSFWARRLVGSGSKPIVFDLFPDTLPQWEFDIQSNAWTRYTWENFSSVHADMTLSTVRARFFRPNMEAGVNVEIAAIKLEEGATATAWTPSPFDAADSATAAATSAANASASDTAAGQKAAAADGSAVAAGTRAAEAKGFRDQSAVSETNAAGSAASASQSAGTAAEARNQAVDAKDQSISAAATSQQARSDASAFAASAQISANLAASVNRLRGNLIRNSTGADGLRLWGGALSSYLVPTNAGFGPRFETKLNGTQTIFSDYIEVDGSKPFVLSGVLYRNATGGFMVADVAWENADGTTVYSPERLIRAENAGADSDPLSIGLTSPAGAVRARVRIFTENVTGNVFCGALRLKLERGALPATGWTDDATDAGLAASLSITAGVAADVQSRLASARFEVIAAANDTPAQLLIRADTSGSLARMVASSIGFANVVGGQIVEAMKLIGGEVFFMRPIYIDVGQSRLIVGPGNGWVLWFGGNDKNAAAATRTNGIFCLGTDSKIYHGSAELGSGVTAKAAQLTFSGSIGRSAPLTTLGTTEAMNVPSTGKFVLDVSAFAESARNGSVTTAQGTLFVFIVKDGVESLLAEAPASTDAPSPGAAVNTRALNMTVQHAHAGAVAFRVKAQGGGSTTWSIGLIDGVLKSTYFPT